MWKSQNKCYWCDYQLTDSTRTRDHFLSKPLFNKYRPPMSRSPSCAACYQCNADRGKISALFNDLIRIQSNSKSKIAQQFFINRKKIRTELENYRKKIVKKMSNGRIKTLCLEEIDEILNFNWNPPPMKPNPPYEKELNMSDDKTLRDLVKDYNQS